MAEQVAAAVGVDPSAVFLAASHTHSGLSLDETYLAPWDPDGSARERRAELMAEIPGIAVAAAGAADRCGQSRLASPVRLRARAGNRHSAAGWWESRGALG